MKEQFLKLILDFINIYPQISNEKVNYVFSGSIATNLISLVSNETIECYKLTNQFYTQRESSLKVNPLFKKFFRPITDIDIELYNESLFKKNSSTKFILDEFDFINYSLCFREHINNIYLDILRSKSKTIYEISINGKSIWIEDFLLNFGYRLKTFAKLSDDRFVFGHQKYEFTKNKYQFDINFMCNIYFQWFGKDQTINYIRDGLTEFLEDNANSPNNLYLNILLRRIKWLELDNKNEAFLVNLIEQLKLEFYKNKFYSDDIFLLNDFSDISNIECINLGKSKNKKYKVKINDNLYLLKSNCFLAKDKLESTGKIIKRINKYLPDNSQYLEFYGYSDILKESYMVYKYIDGKSLNEIDTNELFDLGLKTGTILYNFHRIPVKGLKLKNENNFLNKIKINSYNDSVIFEDKEYIKSIINACDVKLNGIYLLHNDLNLGNIIYDGNKITLIDFDNCSKGDWIIDFKKEIKNNNNSFFDGLFIGYWKEITKFDNKLSLVLSLYEYFYMKNIPKEESIRRTDILELHKQFLNFFDKDIK